MARAGIISFGFVYIHPMVDGNGRISRFLINDVLRRDGAVPTPEDDQATDSFEIHGTQPFPHPDAISQGRGA